MNNEFNSGFDLDNFENNRFSGLLDRENNLINLNEDLYPSRELGLTHSDGDRLNNIIEDLKLTVEDFWSEHLNGDRLLVDLEFQDLPDGQLAEAIITQLDSTGKPSQGKILLDRDADGVGWYVDRTPEENEEFDRGNIEDYFTAKENSAADGKYDLLTTLFHETIHLYGFVEGYSGFDRLALESEISIDGEHLDSEVHPYDLLNPKLDPGVRKLPSELNIEILQKLLLDKNNLTTNTEELNAFLTGGLGAIANGDFSIADKADSGFGWEFRGDSSVESDRGVLGEDSPFQSSISQDITIPVDAKSLKFTIVETQLGSSTSFFTPPDAFEVALLDANTNESLVTDNDLTATDSLLNIQNDGTAYFSDKVRIKGATSGEIIELDKSHTITVDISHLAAGTEATLYFDLLGFGDVDSRVVIDDVQLSDQNLVPPVAIRDTATTTQGQPIIIDILANDTDDDGTIAPDSVEIQTDPSKGFVIPRPDGTVSYIPDTGFAGTDSFTYVVRDNDGQLSEPATVEVTVENAIPEIVELQLPDTIIEGVQVNFGATVTDGGNDLLTYTWNIEGQGSEVRGQNVEYIFPDNGTYPGSLTVTDFYGGRDTRSFDIVVDNAVPIVDAGEDKTINEGSAIAFNGSFSDTGINDTHTVTWDFGDGSTADTSSTSHTYTDNGEYTATYTVTDNDGATASDTVTVTVNNVNPTIESLTGDTTINEGDTATFNATATDPGDDTLTYIWDFGDGSDRVAGVDRSTAEHTYVDNGNYTVTLTVQDEDGGETTQTLDVAVNNVAPSQPTIEGNTTVNEGEAVNYSASATDSGDDELTYSWNFGDNTAIETGENATHTFANNGTYDASVTVEDDDGATATSNLTITVNNVTPAIATESSKTGEEGKVVEFTANVSDPGSDELTVTWDFGDGSQQVIENDELLVSDSDRQSTIKRTYAQDGTYTATVTVTDSDGAVSSSTIDVVINNAVPAIESLTGDTEINEGDTATFNAIASDAGNDELTYTWDFGDGSNQLTVISDQLPVSHTYSNNGDYTVTLTVTDTSGASISQTLDLVVNNTAPAIESVTGDSQIDEGDTATFNAIASDAGNDELTYTWDFGDGNTGIGANTSYIYTDNGTYTVTLTVDDGEGGSTSSELIITANNIPPAIATESAKTGDEGEAVEFIATISDPGNDELTVTWDFGDGSELVTGIDLSTVNHTYTSNGNYTATVTVTDDDGAVTESTIDVVINNVAPVIDTITGDRQIDEGDKVTLEATATDAGNDELTYTWDLGNGTELTGQSVEAAYLDNGIYDVTLSISDGDGGVTTSDLTITVNNVAPIIEPISDRNSDEGEAVEFNFNFSDPGILDTHTIVWDFGDSSTPVTVTDNQTAVAHTYSDNGVYTATLTITDSDGAISTEELTVTVNNVDPAIESLTGDTQINEGDSATFNTVATDVENDKLTYTWDFGDNSEQLTTTDTQFINHVYGDNGTYTVTLIVRDEDGGETTQTLEVTVDNVAPTIDTETTKSGVEGSAVEFAATITEAGSMDSLTITWDFGDGSQPVISNSNDLPITTELSTVEHTYEDDGIYTAAVTVTDSDGATTESTIDVAIANLAPVIKSLTGDTEINEGEIAEFKAIATDAGNDELTYTWDFGDGSEQLTVTSGQLSVNHIYADDGDYTVTITVRDNDGESVSSTHQITVNNTAPVITDLTDDLLLNEGDAINLNVTAIDGGDDELTYAWDFGDGTNTVMGQDVEHLFVDNGLYEATVTVTDSDGAAVTQSLTITVNNIAPILDPWSDETATEGDTVEFNLSFSDLGILDTHTLTWDFGDGSEVLTTDSSETSVSHTYTDDGVYTASVIVTDSDGASSTNTMTVTINNAAPAIASLTGDTEINEGDTAAFNAIATDPGDDTLTYTWNISDGTELMGENITHTFVEDGEYSVELTVSDEDGASTSQTLTIRVQNLAPVVDGDGDRISNEGEAVEFNASFSDPGVLDTHTIEWNFGDGATATDTLTPTHTYTDNGEYDVSLTVTDDEGASTTKIFKVTVNNVVPVITELTVDSAIDEGDTATFNAIASDPGSDELTYIWDFGDNSNIAEGENTTHTFTEDGEYNVNLTVRDDDGASTSQTLVVTVSNVAPIVGELEDRTSNEGQAVEFAGSFSDPGLRDSHIIEWNFGDGNTATGTLNPTHIYTDNGEYDASLTITDDEGASTTKSFKVTVNNVNPIIESLTGDTEVNEGDTANFNATASDPGDDELTYTWDFGDGNDTVIGQDVSHVFTNNGNYTVTLTVNDDDGASVQNSLEVTVDNVTPTITDIIIDPVINDSVETSFNAIATDPGNDTLSYSWDLGDGNTAIGKEIEHTYEYSGNYTITLTVSDSDGAEVTETRDIYVAPTVKSNLKFVQNRLTSKILEDGVVVEEIRGKQNQPIATDFERINISAIDSPDVPNALIDRTNLDNGEGIGVTDGDDYNTSLKKRIDGDEALSIEISPAANYNSAVTATFTVDRLQAISNNTHGGTVKVVALLEGAVVGEQSFNLNNYRDNFTFASDVPFNSLQLMAGDDTKFTFLEVDLETTQYLLPTKTVNTDNGVRELTFYQDQLKSKIFEDGYLVEEYSGGQNQPLTADGSRISINAVDSSDNSNFVDSILLDRGEGIGIRDGNDYNSSQKKRIDGDEILEIAINPTINYNSANSAAVTVDRVKTGNNNGGVVRLAAYWQGELVTQELFNIASDKEKITLDSNLPFDKLAVSAGDNNTQFTFRVAQFTTALTWIEELEVNEGESVNFSAPSNIDGEEFNWDFGDGAIELGKQVSHRFEDSGEYIVTLVAVDNPTINLTATVTVNNIAPTITDLNGDSTIDLGDIANFNAVATDPGNDLLTYSWDLGDGTQLTGEAIEHNFSSPGNYSVTLTVSDSDGASDSQTIQVVVRDPNAPQTDYFNLKAEGKVRINGSSNLEADVLNTDDDSRIYAGSGFTINGNQTLPVQRDGNGNPIQSNGKSVLIEQGVTVSPGYTESNASASQNQYEGLIPPQVIDPLSVTVPEHIALIDEELAARIAPGTTSVDFNPQQNPLNNTVDWANNFPAPGTPTQPTVVNIVGGGLNIPSGVNLAHYVIKIPQGNLNFNGSGHNLNNVALIASKGSINLASLQSHDLAVFASDTININGGARFGGDTLIAMGNSNGNLHFDGATSTLYANSNLKVVSQGNITFNSSSATKGEFIAVKNFTANGRAELIGSIRVKGDITINGGIDLASTNQSSIAKYVDNEEIIYQFVNTDNLDFGGNFYTSNEIEKDYIVDNLGHYQYEGETFESSSYLLKQSQEVYRFFNINTGNHFYTTDVIERNNIIENLEHFSYEGVAFISYETQVEDSIPMYRFYEPETGIHFYTLDETEMNALRDDSTRYNYEGIAYYVKPVDRV